MYFWHVDKLVEDFRNNNVSEKEKFKYFLLFGVLMTLCMDPFMYIGLSYSVIDSAITAGMLIAVIGGTYYCYISNRDVDDKDFISRFLCIGLPIAVRLLIFSIPIMIAIIALEEVYGIGAEGNEIDVGMYRTTVGQAIWTVSFVAIYYICLGNKIKSIAVKSIEKGVVLDN